MSITVTATNLRIMGHRHKRNPCTYMFHRSQLLVPQFTEHKWFACHCAEVSLRILVGRQAKTTSSYGDNLNVLFLKKEHGSGKEFMDNYSRRDVGRNIIPFHFKYFWNMKFLLKVFKMSRRSLSNFFHRLQSNFSQMTVHQFSMLLTLMLLTELCK